MKKRWKDREKIGSEEMRVETNTGVNHIYGSVTDVSLYVIKSDCEVTTQGEILRINL